MTTLHTRALVLLALTLGVVGMAGAVTVAGSNAAATPAKQPSEAVTTGTVSSIDTGQGLLVVSGRLYRFKPATVSFSDDRRKPAAGGLAGLKPGSKVTIHSVTREGANQALQIVVKD